MGYFSSKRGCAGRTNDPAYTDPSPKRRVLPCPARSDVRKRAQEVPRCVAAPATWEGRSVVSKLRDRALVPLSVPKGVRVKLQTSDGSCGTVRVLVLILVLLPSRSCRRCQPDMPPRKVPFASVNVESPGEYAQLDLEPSQEGVIGWRGGSCSAQRNERGHSHRYRRHAGEQIDRRPRTRRRRATQLGERAARHPPRLRRAPSQSTRFKALT